MRDDLKGAAVRLIEDIQAAFPALRMRVDSEDRNVDVSVEIPSQAGLDFRVNLNLQNRDELHLSAGDAFWCSWFPSSDSAVVQHYRNAVTGLLSGRHRIVEYRHWRLTIGADLQEPTAGGWKTIAKSRRGLWPVRWGARRRVVQNVGTVQQGVGADERRHA